MEYSSNAKGNLGVTLGAVGTGLGLLDGGANLLGRVLGGGAAAAPSAEDKPVTRYEIGLIQESLNQKIENSYLRGQLESDNKLDGVKKQLADQLAFNATIGAQVSAVATQTMELKNSFNRLTKVFVPNDHVAPGWGPAVVQPVPPLPPYPWPWPTPPEASTAGQTSTTTNG